MKIAMIFPYAPSYREPIYQLMDRELDVEWFFCGNAKRNLKLFDYNTLKDCNLSMKEKKLVGPITYYQGLSEINLQRYDLVIIAGVIKNISEWVLPLKVRKLKNTRIFCWTHGWYGKETRLQALIKKFYFKLFDGMLLYGDYAYNLLKGFGFPKEKLYVIKNSLDYEKQLGLRDIGLKSDIYKEYFGNTNPNLIFLGRLTSVKRLDLILSAVDKLNHRGENYNVVFVGDGSEKESLMKLAKQLNLEPQVWFVGECFDEQKNAEYIFNADLCIAPGNIGLTSIHSLMFGCPALTHDDFKWQMPEFEAIHSGNTGDFFARNDVDSLTQSISSWFAKHRDDREEIRQNCYGEIDRCWNPEYQLTVIKNILNGLGRHDA